MKSVLIYFPFELKDTINSGSMLRPYKILKAFKKWGRINDIKVLTITGNSKERDTKFKELKKNNELEDVIFCYAENQTIPIWLTDKSHIPQKPLIDWRVFSFLKSKKIPLGIFYRDVYWKFDDIYPLKGIKKIIMKLIYRIEEIFFKHYASAIFLPTKAMCKFVNIDKPTYALPPGGLLNHLKKVNPKQSDKLFKAIYVGSIVHEMYGLELLLNIMEKINFQNKKIELTIVCRKNELDQISKEASRKIEQLGIKIEHRVYNTLPSLYSESDFALMTLKPTTYNNFAVPTKLLEFLSNGLPVVTTNLAGQKDIIEKGPYGVVAEDDVSSFIEAINKLTKDLDIYTKEIEDTFDINHSWLNRVNKVNTILSNKLD